MTIKDYFQRATTQHFAIGAFNAANLETIKAIVMAAKNQNSPVIIEASHGEIDYIGDKNFLDIIANFREETNLPIFTNLDHVPTLEDALKGISLGFNLVHFNGSTLPYENNIAKTKQVADLAHQHNILVEAELDTIPGDSSVHAVTAQQQLATTKLTSPDQAYDFVARTQTDILAASFGSVHGFYQTAKHLDLELLAQIRQKTNCFLSLHGGSGMPDDQVKAAIQTGIVKINVNSELRLAFKQTLIQGLNDSQELALYKIMPPVISAVQSVVETKIQLFGSANKA